MPREKVLDEKEAIKRALRLLSARERSVRQMRERLLGYGFDEGIVDGAIGYLVENRLLSDERYGACFARSKLSAGWGIDRIRRELSSEGISLDALSGWPEEFCDEDELSRARKVLSSAHFTSKNVYASAARKLVSKGFSYDVAMQCAGEYSREKQAVSHSSLSP